MINCPGHCPPHSYIQSHSIVNHAPIFYLKAYLCPTSSQCLPHMHLVAKGINIGWQHLIFNFIIYIVQLLKENCTTLWKC